MRTRRSAGMVAAVLLAGVIGAGVAGSPAHADGQTVNVWLTTSDLSSALAAQSSTSFAADSGSNPLTIDIDDGRVYQTMTGFGATFTESSAWLMRNRLGSTLRSTVMGNLFNPTSGIGLSMLRQPMGSTDFIKTVGSYYTYDDVAGDTDLSDFSVARDDLDIVPMVQQALAINPAIKVNLTSWSAPAWMKDNNSLVAPCQDCNPGTLLSQYYGVYADYLVKGIQAYEARGIPIWATSAQNEPTVGNTYNTMRLTSSQSIDFITNHFAPKLYAAGLQPRIFAGDSVCFDAGYPTDIFTNAMARDETEGSSHHGYCGELDQMSLIHDRYPYKPVYQSELAPYCTDRDFRDVLINGPRNWAQSVISWNVALDTTSGPYHTGAANICDSPSHPGIPIQPLVTIDQNAGTATYRPSYYWTGHLSKFVKPGASRIASTSFGATSVQDVAFLNPDGTRVVVAWNRGSSAAAVKVRQGSQSFSYTLPANAMATFTWSGTLSGGRQGWGDSIHGTNAGNIYAGGTQRGTWTTTSATTAGTTSVGSGWNSLYRGADTRLTDYSMSVDLRRVSVGSTSSFPKYGVYGCYYNDDNYVQAWIDPVANEFVSHVRAGGSELGWSGKQTLPAGFNHGAYHTIAVDKTGDTFRFTLDGVTQPSRTATISGGCQIGLVTEDTRADFTNVKVRDRLQWGDSLNGSNAGNIYGGGLTRGNWVVNSANSVQATSLGSGWNSLYRGAGLRTADYTLSASVRRVAAGTTSAFPKYGVYGCYVNDQNYVQAWIDPVSNQFVSHVLVGGTDLGWSGTKALPAGFNPSTNHTIVVTKSGSTFQFTLDGVAQPSRTAAISGCQVGAVTEDVRANYRNFTVS